MVDRLQELQRAVLRFRDDRDWAQFHTVKDLALGLQIEAAELSELFLWRSAEETAVDLAAPEFLEKVRDELADVQVFLLYLAHAVDLDLGDAVEAKLHKNAAKYPVEKAKGTAKKYTEL